MFANFRIYLTKESKKKSIIKVTGSSPKTLEEYADELLNNEPQE